MVICVNCHAYIPDESLVAHLRWHNNQRELGEAIQAALVLLGAHQENLIERMHEAEKKIDGLGNRVHLMERKDRFPGVF